MTLDGLAKRYGVTRDYMRQEFYYWMRMSETAWIGIVGEHHGVASAPQTAPLKRSGEKKSRVDKLMEKAETIAKLRRLAG